MILNSINYQQAATKVWTYSGRTLTGFGTATSLPDVTNNAITAGGGIVDIIPTAGLGMLITIRLSAGAAGTATVSLQSPITGQGVILTVLAGQVGSITVAINPSIFVRLTNNDGVNVAAYAYTGIGFQQ